LIKKLGVSTKNMMKSVQKRNDLLLQSQLQWRYETDHKWSSESKQSSFQMKQPVPKPLRDVQPKGALWKKKVSRAVFGYLADAWGAQNPQFREFWNQYHVTYIRKCKRNRRKPVPFREWKRSQGNTHDQLRYVVYRTLFVVYRTLIVYFLICAT
jgi:hypothetical protein